MKKILIIIAVVLILVSTVIGTVLITKLSKTTNNEASQSGDASTPYSQIITCLTSETLIETAEKYKVSIEYDGESAYITCVNGWGYNFNIVGIGNVNGCYSRVESYCYLKNDDKEVDAEKLCEKTKILIPSFAKMFGVTDLKDGYYICDNNGDPLDINSIASYEAVIQGNASIKTSVKDSDVSYWELTISFSASMGPVCNIVHYINDSNFASVSGIININ